MTRAVPANDPAAQTSAKLLAQVDYPEARAFVDFLRLKGLSIQALDHYLRTLRDLCRHAQLGERSPHQVNHCRTSILRGRPAAPQPPP